MSLFWRDDEEIFWQMASLNYSNLKQKFQNFKIVMFSKFSDFRLLRGSPKIDHVGRGANARSDSKAIRRGRRPLRTRCFGLGMCQIRSWFSGRCEFRHQIVLGGITSFALDWCNFIQWHWSQPLCLHWMPKTPLPRIGSPIFNVFFCGV